MRASLPKLANQQIVAVTIGAVAEAMMLIEAGGGSPAAFRDAIRGGFAESRILELHGKRMVERQFTPGGSSSNQLKDLNAAMETAKTLSLTLPLTAAVHAEFSEFVANGNGERITAACSSISRRRMPGREESSDGQPFAEAAPAFAGLV